MEPAPPPAVAAAGHDATAPDADQPCALTAREHRRLAVMLARAERERRPLDPLTERWPELTLGDATRIRDALVAGSLGATGCISGAMAGRRGSTLVVHWITDGMVLREPIARVGGLAARLVLRVAFGLDGVRPGPGAEAAVADAQLRACIEVVECRYRLLETTDLDDLAANGGARQLLLGPPLASAHRPAEIVVQASADGDPRREARTSAAALIGAQRELARILTAPPGPASAGGLLLSDPLGDPLPLIGVTQVHADFGELGSMELRIRDTEGAGAAGPGEDVSSGQESAPRSR